MNPSEQLDADIKKSMLSRDKRRTETLRGLKSALTYHLQQSGSPTSSVSQEDFLLIVRREIKKRQDSISEFTKAARNELAAEEQAQLAILEEFLPAALSDPEIDALVNKAISVSGAASKKQMGLAMKVAQQLAAGRVDNSTLSKRIQALLPN